MEFFHFYYEKSQIKLESKSPHPAGLAWFLAGAGYVYPSPISQDDVNFSIALKKPAGVKVRIKLRLEIEDFTGAGSLFQADVNFFYSIKKACVVRVCPKTRLATEGRTGAALGQFLTRAGFFITLQTRN